MQLIRIYRNWQFGEQQCELFEKKMLVNKVFLLTESKLNVLVDGEVLWGVKSSNRICILIVIVFFKIIVTILLLSL